MANGYFLAMKHELGELPDYALDLSGQQFDSLTNKVSKGGYFRPIVVADDGEIGELRLLYWKHVDRSDPLEPCHSFGEEFDVVVLLHDGRVLCLESLLFRPH
jgi:hypothetical protein